MVKLKIIKALLQKDLLIEWRNKYSFNGILLYVFSTVFICYLSFKQINPVVWNALFWIIMLFASVNAVAKSFMQETKGRFLYMYSISSAHNIIISKIIYNALLMMLLALISILFYTVVFKNPIQDMLFYGIAVMLGGLSFSTILTMVSAIAAKVNNNSTLMAILSFPIMVPLLMLLIKFSKNAIDGLERSVSMNELFAILLLNVITIAISLLLFPYLWRE